MKEIISINGGRTLLKLRRRLIKSFMDLLILSKLREEPMAGYDIMLLINKEFHILVGSGSLYSLLHRLEREGLVEGTWNERRRVYELTQKGQATAEITADFYEKLRTFTW